jgi:ferredoxin-NADP reductase
LDSIKHEGADIYTLSFKTDHPLRYEAGQFIELTLPHAKPDDRGTSRWFTLSSSPTEELLTITTRNFGVAASSFKKALFALKVGDYAKSSEAMGDFVLPKDTNRSLLFVAGGIGITPMRSMAQYINDTRGSRDITLLYAASDQPHIVFLDLFRKIKTRIVPLVTSEAHSPRLNAQLIQDYLRANSLIYISGPEPMTEQLVDDLKALGIKEHQLVTDYFPGYTNEYTNANA